MRRLSLIMLFVGAALVCQVSAGDKVKREAAPCKVAGEQSGVVEPEIEKPSFEVSTFDKPRFEKPQFVVPSTEKPVFEKPEFVKEEIERPSFEKSTYDGVDVRPEKTKKPEAVTRRPKFELSIHKVSRPRRAPRPILPAADSYMRRPIVQRNF